MEVLLTLKQAIKTSASIIKWGAGVQSEARMSLVNELCTICGNCDAAYDAVLPRLVPIKNAYSDPKTLATELRAFRADTETRNKFKPEFLCTQVGHLLVQFHDSLKPLKYSIDLRRIEELRAMLHRFQNVDAAIFDSYDQFAFKLDQIATEIQTQGFDSQARTGYAKHAIEDFEAEVRSLQDDMRAAKARVIDII